MKILIVNSFLYVGGGIGTYILKLGEELRRKGHTVQYFGYDDEKRCVGNDYGIYVNQNTPRNKIGVIKKVFRRIYSAESKKKIRRLLEEYQPDVVHLNHFVHSLTPTIINAIHSWRGQSGKKCKIVYTAHGFDLLCIHNTLYDPATEKPCVECLNENYFSCVKTKCANLSFVKALVLTAGVYYWRYINPAYRYIDTIICCSEFLKKQHDTDKLFRNKTITMHNFTEKSQERSFEKEQYVLYFGRFIKDKGICTLLDVTKMLPDIRFVFAGSGPLENEIITKDNVVNVGFKSGEELHKLIGRAAVSVCPSECFENCPFSVIESIMYGTPVIGADIGGIPELIQPGVTGELFESGNVESLAETIKNFMGDKEMQTRYSSNCKYVTRDTVETYCEKLIRLYNGDQL